MSYENALKKTLCVGFEATDPDKLIGTIKDYAKEIKEIDEALEVIKKASGKRKVVAVLEQKRKLIMGELDGINDTYFK